MNLSIVVPCFNESRNIPLILEKFSRAIKREDIEVILVNNGSTDDSQEVLESLVPKYKFARIVNVEVNKGYGYGITSGLKQAKGTYIGYTHADMQTDPSDPIKALEIIEGQSNPENCYIKGDRKGRPFFDQFFTVGMSLFETVYLKRKLWDINAQPNVFHKNFFKTIQKDCPKDFSLDLFFLYKALEFNLQIIRFDVVFPPRIHGSSKWNMGFKSKIKFINRTIDFSKKLKKEL